MPNSTPHLDLVGFRVVIALALLSYAHVACRAQQPSPNPITTSIGVEATSYLDEALGIMREEAVLRGSLDFAVIADSLYAYAAGAVTAEDTHDAIARVLPLLEDHHSAFFPAEVVRNDFGLTPAAIASIKAGVPPNIGAEKRDSLLATLDYPSGKTYPTPTGASVGYLLLPEIDALYAEAMAAYADSLQAIIRELDLSGAIGYVVDLRSNRGGNVAPMAAGLGPLLDVDNVATFRDEAGEVRDSTYYRRGALYMVGTGDAEPAPVIRVEDFSLRAALPVPVAVLVGPTTASSAEVAAAMFAGQSNAVLVGQHTNGLTSGNSFRFLSDDSVLNLTTGYLADRTGTIYRQGIPPDIEVLSEDSSGTASGDGEFERAFGWIEEQTR